MKIAIVIALSLLAVGPAQAGRDKISTAKVEKASMRGAAAKALARPVAPQPYIYKAPLATRPIKTW